MTSTPLWHSTLPNNDLWNHVSPLVTPDGDHITYVTDRSGRWEVWLMNLDGSNQQPLFNDEVQAALNLTYNFVDERMVSWR